MSGTIDKTFFKCSAEWLFLKYKKISKKAFKLGSLFNAQYIHL